MSILTRSTELKRFREGTLPKVALAVLLVIPLIYGALYLWAFWAPTDNLDKLPVAVVNVDEPAEKPDGELLAAGDDVIDELQRGRDLGWKQLDPAEAERAVADGDVYFSVTIPRDFSRTLAGLQDDPKAGEIEVVYNDSNSFLASTLGKQAMVQLRDAVAETATQTAAEQVLVGVEKLSDGTRTAADAAQTLETGTAAVADGCEMLSAGVGVLADGTSQLVAQAPALTAGTSQLASGLGAARDGSAQLAAATGQVSSGAAQLSAGAAELDAKLGEAQAGSTSLRQGMDQLAAQAPALADGIAGALAGGQQLTGGIGAAQGGAGSLAGALGQISALAQEHPDMTLAQLDAALAENGTSFAGLSAGAQQLSDGLGAAGTGSQSLVDGLSALNDGAAALPAQAVEAQAGATRLEQGLAALKSGTETLAGKSGELATGAGQVAGKAPELAGGIAAASDGANRLDAGASKLAGGATRLDAGAQQASEKSGELATGAGKVGEGSATFAEQLADGAAQAPSFEQGQTVRIAETMAAPVQLSEHTENEVQGFGEGFAPFFIALASFVGALITWLILRALPRRPLASNVSGFRTVLTGFLPAALIGLGQVAIMMAVLVFGIGMRPQHWMGMAAFMLLVTLAFLALQQMFIVVLGTATGRVVSLVLLMLMLSSSGGTYPVETTPGFFQALHPFMPASYVVEGLRQLIGGGIDARFWGSLLVMVGVLAGSLAISAIAARRQKVWTIKRLHPSLAI